MHPNAEAKLSGRIKSVVASLRISEDHRLDSSSSHEQLQFYMSEVLKAFGQWLRDVDAWVLLWRSCYLAMNTAIKASKPVPESRLLRDWIDINGSERICEEVLTTLKALPITYIAYVRLPNLRLDADARYELASGVWLLRSEDMAEPEMRVADEGQGGLSALGAMARYRELEPVYLACRIEGYCSSDSGSSAASNALSKMKQVLYLAEVTGILGFTQFMRDHSNASAHMFVQKEVSRRFERELALPILAKDANLSLAFTEFTETILAAPNDSGGRTDKDARLQKAFEVASFCLNNPQDHTDILTAAEWALDSHAEKNETLSYLYAAISLEAILDAPDKDITSVLGDRLAYLIGRSRSDRKDIQDKFKQFYKHRSKIVHGKKARLAPEDLRLLAWAKDSIRSAISRELALASK
jgi:Apea-like HEPN